MQQMHTLFVCTGNMCRSPMAEQLGRLIYPNLRWESAGVMPQGWMHPLAREVLGGRGAAASGFMARDVAGLDLSAYSDIVLIGEPARLHTPDPPPDVVVHFWDVSDPYGAEGSHDEQLRVYNDCADELEKRIHSLVSGFRSFMS